MKYFSSIIPICTLALFLSSCKQEVVAPEQQITGRYALDDGSGTTDTYLEFSKGTLTIYKANESHTLAENKIWNCDPSHFHKKKEGSYSIMDGVLSSSWANLGKVELSNGELYMGGSTYCELKGFESDHYRMIHLESNDVVASYEASRHTLDYVIKNPRARSRLTVTSDASWISDIQVSDTQISFNLSENNSAATRSSFLTLNYDGTPDVLVFVTQEGKPASLYLDRTNLALCPGRSDKLNAIVDPLDVGLIWLSSNTSVAKVSGDGTVTALNIGTATIKVLATDGSGAMATCEVKVKQWPAGTVDLGLSVFWATCNIGATTPEGYGAYYAFGETKSKSNYSWSTYKWGTSETTLTKYNSKSSNGDVDNKVILDPEDDIAYVKLGGKYRMPTYEEWTDLWDKCEWTWTKQNRVNGYKLTSTNGNSIFLPAAGSREYTDLYDAGSLGFYWSSSLDTDYPDGAWGVSFNPRGVHMSSDYRCYGSSVRPVSE